MRVWHAQTCPNAKYNSPQAKSLLLTVRTKFACCMCLDNNSLGQITHSAKVLEIGWRKFSVRQLWRQLISTKCIVNTCYLGFSHAFTWPRITQKTQICFEDNQKKYRTLTTPKECCIFLEIKIFGDLRAIMAGAITIYGNKNFRQNSPLTK